ncbi:MAG TPA: M20/M25/M40 family metallo-hydrolase [Dermatophilaceae bacterium]|nr:M20/M25/M40 family metallo-hydrolase [Dermatophilaceae bacterium]
MRAPRIAVSITATVLAAGLASATVAASPASAGNPNNSAKLTKAVTLDGVTRHLEALQGIATANGGNRAAGNPGYEASGAYVERVLRSAGYTPRRQYFDFPYQAPAALRQVSPDATTYVTGSFTGTGAGDVTSRVTPVDLSLTGARASTSGCQAGDFAGFPSGTIALVQRGGCTFADKVLNAQAAGASAVIIFNQGNDPSRLDLIVGTLAPSSATIPVVGASFADGADLADPAGTVARVTAAAPETRRTFNVIAETGSGRSDNVVMLGAHLDSVARGPGVNDNGSGSAAILETAVQLASVNKLNNRVRFAWWGAEELGLIGSTHYVDDLVANDAAALGDATYLNFDMVASPNYVIGVYDADESTYPAPVPVPPGSAETEDVFTDWFDSQGQPWVDTEFSGRSDYQAFIQAGVPASGLFTGADGTKTPAEVALFGGTAGITYDPSYHTAGDDLANVDPTALDVMSDAVAHATITLAQDTFAVNGARSAGTSGNPHPTRDLGARSVSVG